MYLDEIVTAQKRGKAMGIASVCSAHPLVIRQTLETFEHPLIEATCNQVNQFGGYTGMTPRGFVSFMLRVAEESNIRVENILLGGDHLGPHVWQAEPSREAMAKARVMITDYAEAGFTKLHLDCSMRLGDDPAGALDQTVAAARAAELAKAAEECSPAPVRYVIGTEVPRPGGATAAEDRTAVTHAGDVAETIDVHRKAFRDLGLEAAWDRVVAVVVQPGVEFGDDFVVPYRPEEAQELSKLIEGQPMVYEAHSTDYQTPEALCHLVRDHFAILKVGPALTFAYREAVFALAMLEDEWIPEGERSNLLQVLDDTMTAQPGYWNAYYRGTEQEQAFKRKFSLSDRSRYYWAHPGVQRALDTLMRNVVRRTIPYSLSSQFLGTTGLNAEEFIRLKIQKVLETYRVAAEQDAQSR